jgi:hypothetical protein
MRFLASGHLFREVKPDVFAHSMSSSFLATKKSIAEILKEYVAALLNLMMLEVLITSSPAAKHDGIIGIAALVECT